MARIEVVISTAVRSLLCFTPEWAQSIFVLSPDFTEGGDANGVCNLGSVIAVFTGYCNSDHNGHCCSDVHKQKEIPAPHDQWLALFRPM